MQRLLQLLQRTGATHGGVQPVMTFDRVSVERDRSDNFCCLRRIHKRRRREMNEVKFSYFLVYCCVCRSELQTNADLDGHINKLHINTNL